MPGTAISDLAKISCPRLLNGSDTGACGQTGQETVSPFLFVWSKVYVSGQNARKVALLDGLYLASRRTLSTSKKILRCREEDEPLICPINNSGCNMLRKVDFLTTVSCARCARDSKRGSRFERIRLRGPDDQARSFVCRYILIRQRDWAAVSAGPQFSGDSGQCLRASAVPRCISPTNDQRGTPRAPRGSRGDTKPIERALKEQRGVINDIHPPFPGCFKKPRQTPIAKPTELMDELSDPAVSRPIA